MATHRKPRFMISLDDDSSELLTKLQRFTGLSPAQTIQKIFPAHLEELHAYLAWLEELPPGTTLKNKMGPHLLQSYGPESLIQSIKNIDPQYKAPGEQLCESI